MGIAAGVGDRILNGFNSLAPFPITSSDAIANGWVLNSTCIPGLGYAANFGGSRPSSSYPVTLYFAPNKQISGYGMDAFGSVPDSLANFWLSVADGQSRMTLFFRDADVCSQRTPYKEIIGDRMVINNKFPVPMNASMAADSGFTKGSCFAAMGVHWSYDLQSHPQMSWYAANMLPIVPMYLRGTGQINAVFFATWNVQQGVFDRHSWDSIAIPSFLMCKNWCDDSCSWQDTSFFSTGHVFFRDPALATCENG